LKRTVATPLSSATCVITGDLLNRDSLFVLPCCSQDIDRKVIVTWLKQSTTHGCPCCRNNTDTGPRPALLRDGHDLTVIVHPELQTEYLPDGQIVFDQVMAGIAKKTTIGKQCQKYLKFGIGLMDLGQYRLAHQLIEFLGEKMACAGSKDKPVIAKSVLTLLERYNDGASGKTIQKADPASKFSLSSILGMFKLG